jgi:tetratricopeptide (TPR) repeat protein
MESGGKKVVSYSFVSETAPTPSKASHVEKATTTTLLETRPEITSEQILWGFSGVAAATGSHVDDVEHIQSNLPASFQDSNTCLTLREWHLELEKSQLDDSIRQSLNLAIALAFLIESGRQNISVSPSDLHFAWNLIYGALLCDSIQFKVNRSALGYHSVPLWSHAKDGNIDELFRLHVWIPDDHKKRTPISNIHTHQAFSQGWILTGLGTDYVYDIKPADMNNATHTEFNIAWNKDKPAANDRITQQSASSTMTNMSSLVRALPGSRRPHSRGMNYTVPAGKYHSLDVNPDELHATLFFFDSRRGFQLGAPALGPINGSILTLPRTAPDATAAQLAKTVDCLRQWEVLFAEGKLHVRNAEWEEGLRALKKAEHLCDILDGESHSPLKHAPRYKWAIQGEIGHAYRMLGRNVEAIEVLNPAIKQMPKSLQQIELLGELSVVYRHLNRLEASKDCSAKAYKIAKELLALENSKDPGPRLKLEKEMCRTIGDWGMINYQLFLDIRDPDLLDTAMKQMNERVDIARRLKVAPELQSLTEEEREELREYCSQREAIALARLSLCFTEKGELGKAIASAHEALEIQIHTQSDPTKVAFSRYFYGRALLRAGRREEAKAQFNAPGGCTPAIALCKEASDEHRSYIRQMIAAGADMELRDEQGYSALECAVYCGDMATQLVIEEGLRKKFSAETARAELAAESDPSITMPLDAEERLDRLRYEAHVRKGYRQLVQDTLRPVLLQAQDSSGVEQFRIQYANALKGVNGEKLLFDTLKVVYYSDFIAAKRIPKYGDGYTREIVPNADGNKSDEFIIFFSYRWVGSLVGTTGASPDDSQNTQYQRMVRALDKFVEAHHHIDRQKLCVWIVSLVFDC